MLSESLRVPYRADDASGTILVGSVLTFLTAVLLAVWVGVLIVSLPVGLAATPVVALPSLVTRGYLLRAVDSGIRNDKTVPSFVRWGSLVRAGAKSTLISVIYFLPGAVFCGLALGGGAATVLSPSGFDETMQALTGVLIMVSGFGLLLYGLVYLYVRPAARAVFASTGSLRAALGVRRVVRLSTTGDYLTGWLIAMGLLTVGPTVLLPLVGVAVAVSYLSPAAALLVLLVTVLLGLCLGFVVRVSAAWATGRGAATGLSRTHPTALEDTPDNGVMVTATESTPNGNPTPTFDASRPEADPTVQTGRTVRLAPADTESADQADASAESQSTPTEAADPTPTEADSKRDEAENSRPEREAPESPDGDRVEETTPEASETVDTEDDTGFVWGVDDE